MLLSDLSVRRPVLATVVSLIILVLGWIGSQRLAVRELPDIDAPAVAVEPGYLKALLEAHNGNMTATARTLGIPRSTLRDRLRREGAG